MRVRLSLLLCILVFATGLVLSCEEQEQETLISSITISQPSAELEVGESLRLSATTLPSKETDIIWASSKQSVASVDETGLVTAIAKGETIITATAEGKRDQCKVIVNELAKLEVACATGDASDIDCCSSTLSGLAVIKNAVEETITTRFYYSCSLSDVASLSKDGSVENGHLISTVGCLFSASISNLEPETTYYYIASISVDGKEFFGEVKSFMTMKSPIRTSTGEALAISERSAELSGYIDPSLASNDVTAGIIYSKDENPTVENGIQIIATGFDDNGFFTVTARNLASNTKYCFKSFINNGGTTLYGDIKSFTTKEVIASVETLTASDVGEQNATMRGRFSVTSEESLPVQVWFLFIKSADATIDNMLESGYKAPVSKWSSDGQFEFRYSGFDYGATYSYVSVAKIYDKEFYGNVVRFTNWDYAFIVGEAVDLGLSVKWSSNNLGAHTPFEFGAFYSWGETEPKKEYSWSSYKWSSGSSTNVTKYNTDSSFGTKDDKTILDPEDDAAHVVFGGNWRMPTDEEWAELCNTDNCIWTWTDINGTKGGYMVISKITGNSIFLPAAGYRLDDYGHFPWSYGLYWSSTLNTQNPRSAVYLRFHQGYVKKDEVSRFYGCSIRPVLE